MVKDAEWTLSPYNRCRSLAGIIFVAIVLHRNGNRVQIQRQIASLRQALDELKKACQTFRSFSDDVLETLKMRNLPLETYISSVYQLQNMAETMFDEVSEEMTMMLLRTDFYPGMCPSFHIPYHNKQWTK